MAGLILRTYLVAQTGADVLHRLRGQTSVPPIKP